MKSASEAWHVNSVAGQSPLREKMLNALTHPAETSSTTGRGGKSAKAIALNSVDEVVDRIVSYPNSPK